MLYEMIMGTIGLLALYLILGLGVFILYVYTLVQQWKRSQPVWFVLTLLIPFIMVFYWISRALGGSKGN